MGHGESQGQATGLMWAWDLAHTLMALASRLEYLDCVSAHAIIGEGEDNKWCSMVPLTPERVPTVSSHLADAVRLVN